jgi:hypothetical protein
MVETNGVLDLSPEDQAQLAEQLRTAIANTT